MRILCEGNILPFELKIKDDDISLANKNKVKDIFVTFFCQWRGIFRTLCATSLSARRGGLAKRGNQGIMWPPATLFCSVGPPYESLLSTACPQNKISIASAMLIPWFQWFAEREGFEPPDPWRSTVFKTAAFDHSAISPIFQPVSCIPDVGQHPMLWKGTAKVVKKWNATNFFANFCPKSEKIRYFVKKRLKCTGCLL